MCSVPTWGLVATIKAPARDILNFAAHHLDLGAHRVHVYLDAPEPEAEAALAAHPKCRVTLCDNAYWQRRRRKGRPEAHQPRQSINATHCLNRRPDVDWLAHIDVDEFLWPETPLPCQLAALPDDVLSARVRPIEALAPDPHDPPPEGTPWFKSCARLKGVRAEETAAIYPTFGAHLNGGFLSHVAGKVFVRTGVPGVSLRIHNAFRGKEMDDSPPELTETRLCHFHAHDWEDWRARLRYRHAIGAYRPEIKPAGKGGLPIHDLLAKIEAEGGEPALRAFFTEVCTATPALRARLKVHGHLHAIALDLDAKRARHFSDAR
ncbi:glycosyltransferase family 2 protein [Roseovarius autotrophicus]|uniref:glycosyltransferase family 2 protein n=1 Tax=Roseovarius autotrophicus TaxID=2824121 RepID=UPI0019DFAFC2|nr:glycosyltransferase family 2 protein [Roseovarius autotrophicus]MBE0455484.1 glycosyltransferase family 2 protein [Roseovarius sp.]